MVRAFSNEHSDAFPFEGEALPHTSAFVQNTPRSTLPYLEQNPPFPSSVYDPYMQPPWAFVGFGLSIPATSPQIGMDSITGWVGDNASPAGAENTINSSCIGSERSDPNCHQQGQFSAPIGDQLKEAAYEASPPDNRTSRRRRSKLNAKRSLTGPIKCDWKDCTNPRLFTRDTSLWRHIKEKHIFSDAFKCSSLSCDMSFGRKDKLNEHLRSAHAGGECQKGGCRRSCHA